MFVFTTENGSVIDANGEIYLEIGPDGMFCSTVDGVDSMPEYTVAE